MWDAPLPALYLREKKHISSTKESRIPSFSNDFVVYNNFAEALRGIMGTVKPQAFELESQGATTGRFSVQPVFLLFVAFASTTLFYSPVISNFFDFSQGPELIQWFVFPMFFACCFVALATIFYAAWRPRWQSFSLPVLVVATFLYIAGSLAFYVCMQLPDAHQIVAAIAGVGMGFGLVPLGIAWGVLLAYPLRRALFVAAFTCLIASLFGWILSLLPTSILLIAYPLLLIAGAGTPLAKAIRARPKTLTPTAQDQASMPAATAAQPEEYETFAKQSLLASVKNLLSIIWIPFLGLLLYAYLTSVQKLRLFEILDSEFLGGVVAAFGMLCLCFVNSKKPILPFVARVMLPAAIAIMIVMASIPSQGSPSVFVGVGMYVIFIFLALFTSASLMAATYAREFTPPFIYGLTFIFVTAISLLGLFQTQILNLTESFDWVMWIIASAFFGIVIISTGVNYWRTLEPADGEGQTRDLSYYNDLGQRCKALSQRFKLSPREEEILSYLSRGYNPVYISKTLFISVSTARSHVRNIYRKIGIGSHEELLELIDSES